MIERKTNFRSWIKKAEHDFLAIQNNISAIETPWDVVCFHAQQVAEKILKAFLVYHGQAFEKTHDLVQLLASCVKIETSLSVLEEDCQRLNYYAVSSRYPDDIYEPDESDGQKAINSAQKIQKSVLSFLVYNE
jgi:HEPN domain-containing protein